ncbi:MULTISPECIES: Gabija anti-phage system endonuclease GajA [Bacillus cereus group]|uniref:AAA family ATPase n=1 Tax=Bacillus cereus TaxID=1396 RepID=A0A9W7QJ24_BACCE|nr:Gabija anti-phage system endonuclease GajA [Bacillus cereus]KAB2399535.1 AAA family ATPase [Bacillus cereus]KAB2400884.1 AAA family ATPase [Bacillus cereus]KAB2431309.1 AAA family ATPase [Bacillus cereus]
MYLKSLKIYNFRKFGIDNNKIEFVDAKSFQEQKNKKEINIAPTTTLIVGKNNCGKTTIIKALDNLINNKDAFKANDFNFLYLKKLLDQYEQTTLKLDDESKEKIETPYLQFNIGIGIEDNSNDLVTNLVRFMKLDDINNSELEIGIKVELENEEVFIRDVKKLLEKNHNSSIRFSGFLELINNSVFKLNYYNADNDKIENFNIKNLIELRPIKANNIESEKCLSKAFSKIIEYRYKSLFGEEGNDLNSKISDINEELTKLISEKHTHSINESLGEIESNEKLKVLLRADLSFQKVMNNLIKYEYVERDMNIPENQFGLGYTNLMMIIADLIDYMEKYPENSFNSKVNLISIEEPETFMHPQMQELFIKNINEAIASLLKSKNKNVNSQLVITTHSSHILNSKIHSGNTFNNINYVTTKNNYTHVVNLRDDIIIPKSETNAHKREDDLKFLKKHVKYKVSELFFSDAIIFVEGVTEETLLKYYIDNRDKLNKNYISVFNIDGAHGIVYHDLIKALKVPALIITDLDIKRATKEKENFKQISDLKDRLTTNETIKKYNGGSDRLEELRHEKFEVENVYIAYQGKIKGYYATSFEEAFILTNYENKILNSVLEKMKPKIYEDIIGENKNLDNIKGNSYKLQKKLSNNKSDFANELLYKFITETEAPGVPSLPQYIDSGLLWLTKKLEGEK